MAVTDSIPSDSLTADTLGLETPGLHYGIMLDKPLPETAVPLGSHDSGLSWLITALVVVFVIACLKYRKNSRYLSLLLKDVLEIRERHNAFDDTLREMSFVWLLNILWIGGAGVLLYGMVGDPGGGIEVGPLAICIGLATAYTLFLTAAYAVVGNLFSDGAKASFWVKGFLSTQGLEGILLFPVALAGLCVPPVMGPMIIAGIIIFLLAKLLFIYKGFCIFFTQITSWVLFLYYLCSLEIVPLVLTYTAALTMC